MKVKKKAARARATNEISHFLGRDIDGRSMIARRFADICALVVEDIAGGDPGRLSVLQIQQIKRAAALACECERLEGQMTTAGNLDLEKYVPAANAFRRAAYDIGLDRTLIDATPSIRELKAATPRTSQKAPKYSRADPHSDHPKTP